MSLRTDACIDPSAASVRNSQAFDLWAQSYDAEKNPLLVLERRYLERMLPDLSGRDALDAGCGSGRWLGHLLSAGVCSVRGIDTSSAMLQIAQQNNPSDVELVKCSCIETSFANQSFDFILSSFVLSYIDNLNFFAAEIDRIARSGCDLFLSDMHPVTQHRLGWKRTFHSEAEEVELETTKHQIADVVRIFESLGWRLCAALEPEFSTPEREIFAAAQRVHCFHQAAGSPAIYLLHLQKFRSQEVQSDKHDRVILSGASCGLGPQERTHASLQIGEDRVTQILSETFLIADSHATEIDLTGYLLLPGFVNAHDHLEFALFPHLGNPPYPNASAWARDIHENFADTIAKHRSIPKNVRLWWGALRNLLCGVTTVCHHNPWEPEFERDDFPIRIVRNFGWDHSLAFGTDLRSAHSATRPGSPFIVHACEGIDDDARSEIQELDSLGVLDENTVLIHGLAIDTDGLSRMQQHDASLVVCPSSNHFLFGETPDPRLINGIRRVALGSDSPLTAAGDLLDEARFAIDRCNISPQLAYSMLTDRAKSILRLKNSEGSLSISGAADMIAIRDTHQDPAERMRTLSTADIEFVMINGRVQVVSEAMLNRLPPAMREGLQPLLFGGATRWLRAPIDELLASAEAVLGEGQVRLGGKPVCAEPRHVH